MVTHHAYPLLLGAGFQFSFLMGRLILAHLTHEQEGMLSAMFFALLPLPFAVANAWAGTFHGRIACTTAAPLTQRGVPFQAHPFPSCMSHGSTWRTGQRFTSVLQAAWRTR